MSAACACFAAPGCTHSVHARARAWRRCCVRFPSPIATIWLRTARYRSPANSAARPICSSRRTLPIRKSIDRSPRIRTVEREGRDRDIERFAVDRGHAVGTGHEPGGRRKRNAARVFEGLAGLEYRLFADHAGPFHLLPPPVGIGDAPMARTPPDRLSTPIRDFDGGGPG